jgi:putative ABC transport system permease protein
MKIRGPRFLRHIIAVFRWSAHDDEMSQEMAFHVEAMTREYIRSGMSEADAARAARKRFGSVLRHKEAGHDTRSAHLDELVQDMRSGIRQLTGAPTFALVAAITLALGIGVNAAVFAVVKSALLDALPYTDADRLVRVYGGARAQLQRGPLSAGTISDIRDRQRSLASLAAFMDFAFDAVYGSDSGPQVVRMAWVERSFFDTLGVSAARGRVFRREDALSGLVPLTGGALAPDAPSPVMLTHSGWMRLFGGDEAVLGRDVRVNGIPRHVIGVLPSNYVGPMGAVDFYFAFDLGPVLGNALLVRGSQWLGGVGRLKPGVAHETARDEIAAIWTDLVREYPADNRALGLATIPLREAMVGNTRTPLLVLMASAGLVLFITCANLAGALLSRAVSRRKEFAIRAALGAGRGRLVRQLLIESIVLAVAGGGAGVVIASVTLDRLGTVAAGALPGYVTLSLDWGAVLVTGVIAIATGLLFGAAPAMSIERSQAQSTVRDDSRGSSESRRSLRLRGVLVAGQLALCLSLLVGAGLLARSLWAMTGQSLGFEPDGLLTAALQLPLRDYATPESRVLFRTRLEEQLRSLPGVTAVATATSIPTAVRQRNGVTLEGAPSSSGPTFVITTAVSDDYFRTLQIPLHQGRTFGTQDLRNTPTKLVISESMARRFWPDGNAIGQRVRLGPNLQAPLNEIVGIVGDVRNDLARADAEPMAYLSTRQTGAPNLTILVRAQGDPLALATPMERAVASLDPGIAVQRVMTMPVVLGEGIAGRRLPVLLMAGFGVLALLLASVGVYAMFASLAGAREREFGIRLALGSRPGGIAALVLRQGAAWMAAGLAAGAFGIVLVVRLVRDLLYQVEPFDPVTVGVSVAVLVVCATIALLIPVHRATRVDAAVALRAQ